MKIKLYKLKNLFLLLAMVLSVEAFAQRELSGVLTDGSSGEPLIGATVLIKGTNNGTVTDIDGAFTISANEGDVLVFSYTGFDSQEITVAGQSSFEITMTAGVTIDEVVVTGYSVDTRRSTPGSVSTIKASDLKITPSGNVEQQLQGRVAGLTVITNGQPGTTSQVRIRGFGALGGNEPLYIVDGVPVSSTDFLSPDDIETTTVLKDATAASIYGARAAGGVIVYTTKKGNYGKKPLTVTYDGTIGVTTPGNGAPILNPQDHAEWTWNAFENGARQAGVTPVYFHEQFGTGSTPVLPEYLIVGNRFGVTGGVDLAAEAEKYNVDPALGGIYQVVRANKEGTNWYDEITRNALLNRHNLGFSGGGDRNRFYIGIGMQDQDGILVNQKFSRYTIRLNTEFEILPGLRFGENIQGTYRSTRLLLGGDGGSGSSDDENFILDASRMASIIPVRDEFGGYAGTAAAGFNNPRNPVAAIEGAANDRGFGMGVFGNIYLEFDPIENLTLRTSFGGTSGSSHFYSYGRRQYENKENNSAFSFNQGSSYGTSWVMTNTATYKVDLTSSIKLDLLVGQEALNFGSGRGISGSGLDPFSQNPDFVQLNNVGSRVVNGGHGNGVNFSSYFGRANIDINDKYILSGVLRRDGSSRFGAENRYGVFPAISAAWRISGESFMSGSTVFDDLKIRGGWGIMGNSNNVDPNNQFSLFGTSLDASSYDISGTNTSAQQGFYRTRVGNPFAKWERAITANVGLDALLFNGRLDVGVEVWNKDTEDLLFRLPQTVQSGPLAQAPSVNIGKMRNSGVDFKIVTKGGNGDLKYSLDINGGFLNNEIVELADGIMDLPNRSVSYRGITPVLNQVGQPLSAFFGYEVLGLFKDAGEVSSAPTQDGAAPGRFRYADLDGFDDNGELTGSPDGKIDAADRTVLGSPIPDFTGGLTIKLDYKNFGLELYTYASLGNEIYNISKLFTDFYSLFPGAAISERVKDSWTFDNPTGTIPIFETASNFSTNTQSSSFYVEDGSYLRVQNLTLSYSLPTNVTSRWNVQSLRFFGSVNNLLTLTGYEGLDPSVGGAADTNFGIDLGNYPITRSWTFGVNVGF